MKFYLVRREKIPSLAEMDAWRFIFTLSQVHNLSLRKVLAVEDEGAVGNTLRLEVAYRNGTPSIALTHLDLRRDITLLVDGENQLLHRALLVLCHQANLIVAAYGLHRGSIARLVDVDEGVWIHGHLLCLGRIAHVYLVGLLHVGPLRLAVVPYRGLSGAGIKLVALDGDGAAGGTILRTRHAEVGTSATLVANYLGGLI